jgi:phage shock protein PspC (stress-responsive transcriptional regulator)
MVDMTSQTSDQTIPDLEPTTTGHEQAPVRRLTRSRDDKYLGGVCGGIAAYTGVDANVVRLLAVLGTVLGFGVLIFAYVAAWLLLPEG